MSPSLVIARKRDGHELGGEEIAAFVRGAADGSWADYQLSALLMAICLRGMTAGETARLTEAMVRSGAVADLSGVPGAKVDKHSTGGVGDKVSISLAPLVAACGVRVPMMSGRGLGHTGGTLDKLEAIPGFRTGLSLAEYRAQIGRIGLALIGQTDELAPADRKLYALRDVTGTVESIPLICASILSKKLAEGAEALVLDVKFGSGAFLPERSRALELADALVRTGRALGLPVRAVLTSMEQPLGRSVGNALEVAEAIDCLRGRGPADVLEVTLALGAEMLVLGRAAASTAEARSRLEQGIVSGAGLSKFREVVAAQGGDPRVADDPSLLPAAPLRAPVPSPRAGFVRRADARALALAALGLGAGRRKAEDRVDPSVGIAGLAKVGERVAAGAPLAIVHAAGQAALAEGVEAVARGFEVGDAPPPAAPLVAETIG